MGNEEKFQRSMRCLDRWLTNHEKGKKIVDYLNTYQIHRVGIYGYGMLGKHLVRELRAQDFPVSWVVDKSANNDDACCNLIRPNNLDKMEDVDLAIITTLAYVEEVENILLKYVTGRIISVDELIDSVYGWENLK